MTDDPMDELLERQYQYIDALMKTYKMLEVLLGSKGNGTYINDAAKWNQCVELKAEIYSKIKPFLSN